MAMVLPKFSNYICHCAVGMYPIGLFQQSAIHSSSVKNTRSVRSERDSQVMADRTCTQCGTVFKYPKYLREHQKRKTSCSLVVNLDEHLPLIRGGPDISKRQCRFCNRVFSSYVSMRRHVRESCKIAPNAKNGDKGMERLYEHTLQRQNAEQNAKIDRLEAQNSRLESQNAEILALLQQQGSFTSTTSTQQAGEVAIQASDHAQVDNSKKIININVFGQEKLDHITAERIKTILDECLQRALPTAVSEAVLKTAMLVYSDPDRPENLTAYLPNKKLNAALVHTLAGWEVRPTQLVLPPMALKSIDTLFGNQPHEEDYAPLLKELQQNEARFAAGEELRPLLIRNKDLLTRVLATLPVAEG